MGFLFSARVRNPAWEPRRHPPFFPRNATEDDGQRHAEQRASALYHRNRREENEKKKKKPSSSLVSTRLRRQRSGLRRRDRGAQARRLVIGEQRRGAGEGLQTCGAIGFASVLNGVYFGLGFLHFLGLGILFSDLGHIRPASMDCGLLFILFYLALGPTNLGFYVNI
ncbi:hypothetical protein ERO13_D02G018700v2 [Gossypium hirsutum]|uniref:Uncharacterized protein n=2 Tax=Gossypium TaxID=3633 RepID=A0A1U8M7S8_GOSHI|nr:uncharacterized protein LOC107934813 [Gossypium hirsutum]KAG4156783.1 hypothetical protein ERO13_D02G018700v2 [Gossypium hirsutum]TYH81994.1 hypothetical protein ES332_D02G025400v1 [Gossypium tomentosum]